MHKQLQPITCLVIQNQVPVKQENNFPITKFLTYCWNKLGIKIREEIKNDNGNSLGEE